ncbi:uncharacterized protein UBRO2_00787 [Ustilago bromivora]|uniref:Uncharacterized protein n=1 Tax=Ustilago bromivora TaxID=307758 RepID=A0A8H8QHS1_9BASI|nr:uncharacterized protein UBRO2_00787 [Ustilago bromivora]
MRTLYFFATAYILMAAVACQPLREAKAELEVSRKAYRKPRQPLKPPRTATPKAKRRNQAIGAATEAISDLFSHFGNPGRAARNAASVEAQTDIKPLESTAYTRFQQSPSAKFDGIANPARPESLFKPRNKPFRFGSDQGGYVADADHAVQNAKLYGIPPFSTKLGIGADASVARIEEDHLALLAEEKRIAAARRIVITSVAFAIASGQILWSVNRAANGREANIQARARASESEQAAMQQAAAEIAALRAPGSGGSNIQRRSLSSEDMAAHDASVRTSQPKDDRSLRKRSVVPIIKSEKAADKEDQSKTLTKRFNPLEIIGNAAERTRASIGSRASSFRDTLQEYTQDRRRLVGPIAACIVSMLGLIGVIIYYEVKSQELDNDLHGSNTEPAEPRPFPPVLRLKDVDNRDDSAFIQTSKDEKLHHTELQKRWGPVTAMIDCWQGRVEDSRRVSVVVTENAPSSPRLLFFKLFTGVAALLGVSGALFWYGYRRQPDSTPKPQESKQPETASVPVPNRQHFAEVRHKMLNKRSLDVEPAAHVDVLSVEQGRPALLKREVTDEKIKRLLVRGNPGVTQIPLHKREVLQAQGATNYPTRRSLRRGDEHLEDLPLKDGHLVKRAIGAVEVEGPAEETLRLLDRAEREKVERLRFRNELQRRRRLEAFRKALRSKRILGDGIVATLSLAFIITYHQKLTAARKREQAARRKARGAAIYPVRGPPHKRDFGRSAAERLGGEGSRLLDHPAAAEFPGTDVAVRRCPAFSRLYRNILIGSAIAIAAEIQGPSFWLAIRALKQQTPIQRAAKRQAEEERLQAGFKRSRRPGHLSKRMISRAAISLAVQDFKSLANKAPLTPAEKLARAQRLRKYALVGAGLAAVKGVESLVVYEILQSYKENKRVKQQLQEIKQQQTSGYVGNSYYAPNHILSKRATIRPVGAAEVTAAEERAGHQAYEAWKQKVLLRLKKVGVVVGIVVIAMATAFGLRSAVQKHYGKKENPNDGAIVDPFHKRDLSSQAQKEESHELAKREPACDGLVEAGIPKTVPHNPAGGRRAELSQAVKLMKRLMLPTNGVQSGAAFMRLLRQVAIGFRRNGLIDPAPHQSQSSSDDWKSRNRHAASPVPLFFMADVTKSPVWQEKIRKLQRKHAEEADDDEPQEYDSRHHRSLMKRMVYSRLSGVVLATWPVMAGYRANNDIDRMWAHTHLPRPPRIVLFPFFSRDDEKQQRLPDPARMPRLLPPFFAVDGVHQHAPLNAVAGQRREQQRSLAKRSTTQYSKLSVTVFGTFLLLQGLRATQAIKEHGRGNRHDRSPYHSTYPAPRPRSDSHFITGPPSAPLSIQTLSESVASASETFRSLVASSANGDLALHPADAFLVACFSDHPLVGMLRSAAPGKPAMHLLEAALLHALCVGRKFGILTTGKSVVPDVEAGVSRVLGGNSDRYVATVATGLGVVELKDGCREKVEGRIKQGAKELVGKGADVVILGCAGMTGMEAVVQEGCKEVGVEGIKVVDGALAGMQLLAGLGRLKYLS